MILVTGAAGHLGANLVRRLLDDGEAVRVLLRPHSDNSAMDGLDVDRVFGDLRDRPSATFAVRGCERVYHVAARVSTVAGGEQEIYDCNVLGTRHLLGAAREAGCSRVVVTGSFSAVGHVANRASDEDVPFNPFHGEALPYEWTKVLVELETLRAVAEGLDAVIATSCAIIGPNDYKPSRMGRTLMDFANGDMAAWVDGGFEFVAARDIVEGHVLAMKKGRRGQKYIFSSEFVTVDELMGIFESVTGRPRPRLRMPRPLMLGLATVTSPILARLFPERPQRLTPAAVRLLNAGWKADTAKARSELGFRPTSVAAAVRLAYEDFARRGLIRNPRRPIVAAPSLVRAAAAPAPSAASSSEGASSPVSASPGVHVPVNGNANGRSDAAPSPRDGVRP